MVTEDNVINVKLNMGRDVFLQKKLTFDGISFSSELNKGKIWVLFAIGVM